MYTVHTRMSNSISVWQSDVQLVRRQGLNSRRLDSTMHWPTRLPAIHRRSLSWPYKNVRFLFIWWNEIQFLNERHDARNKKTLVAIAIFLAHNASHCQLPRYWHFYKSIYPWKHRIALLTDLGQQNFAHTYLNFVFRINLFAQYVSIHKYHWSLFFFFAIVTSLCLVELNVDWLSRSFLPIRDVRLLVKRLNPKFFYVLVIVKTNLYYN